MKFSPNIFLFLLFFCFFGIGLPSFTFCQNLYIVAGNCSAGYASIGMPATQTSLWEPDDLAFDSLGNYYIADAGSCTVRKVTVATGILTNYVGAFTTVGGFSGDGGPATQALMYYPSGIVFDSNNSLYIADFYNCVIRRVDAATGLISTFAGSSTVTAGVTMGIAGYSGDGGPATLAKLQNPTMVRFDPTGRYLAISDEGNCTVREVDTTTGLITTVAGNGTAGYSGNNGPATLAELNQPDGLAFDTAGNLYIADNLNGAVREVNASTGIITTVAGTGVTGYSGDNRPATQAQLCNDIGSLNFNCNGNLLIADGLNNRVRMVDVKTGIITTVIGTGSKAATCSTNNTPVLSTDINLPQALVFDHSGNLYLVDYGYSLVQEMPGGFCLPTPIPTPPFSPSDCSTIETYSYPNPARGSSMNILYVLCEAGSVKIQIFNSIAEQVGTYDTNGSSGPNVHPVDISSYTHGLYYYLVVFNGDSGTRKSKPTKFAIARSP